MNSFKIQEEFEENLSNEMLYWYYKLKAIYGEFYEIFQTATLQSNAILFVLRSIFKHQLMKTFLIS